MNSGLGKKREHETEDEVNPSRNQESKYQRTTCYDFFLAKPASCSHDERMTLLGVIWECLIMLLLLQTKEGRA
jgi:hypothetical protein